MEEIVLKKGMRCRPRRKVGPIELRPEVYDWLFSLSESSKYAIPVIVRALIEDAFDRELCVDQEVRSDD